MNIPKTLSVGRHRKTNIYRESVNQNPLDTMIVAEETARLSQQNAILQFDFIILLYDLFSDCTKNWAGRSPEDLKMAFFQTKRLKKPQTSCKVTEVSTGGFSEKNTP